MPGSWFDPAFAGERVPTLEEALALAAELDLGVNIEIKADRGREYATAAAVADTVNRLGTAAAPLCVELSAGRRCGVARSRAADAARHPVPLRAERLGGNRASGLAVVVIGADHRRLRPRRVAEIRAAGYPVAAYTVNDPARARLLFAWGVTSVFSDMPDMILQAGAVDDSARDARSRRRMPRGRSRELFSVKPLNPIVISGREVLPLVEGGKGISVSNGESSGAWAASGGVGTFSGVNADSYNENGELIPQVYYGRTRRERHEELVAYAIAGGIQQARVAHERSNGQGRIHMNVLWEMAAAERVLHGVLEGARGLIHGVTCGAGMPYRIAEICGALRRLLLPDRLVGARVSRAVEARLPQVPRLARRRRLRGPVAGRRP